MWEAIWFEKSPQPSQYRNYNIKDPNGGILLIHTKLL